jgi:hypothetical protein
MIARASRFRAVRAALPDATSRSALRMRHDPRQRSTSEGCARANPGGDHGAMSDTVVSGTQPAPSSTITARGSARQSGGEPRSRMGKKTERRDRARERELNPHHSLLESLFAELFQSERSAELHPAREASRLGDETAPARALRAVSQHARSVRGELRELARERDLSVTQAGRRIGDLFSWVRRFVSDGVMEEERSYRATLLGMRHGIDLVELVRGTAESADDAELAAWCTEWLNVREPLVEEVRAQLAWFAWHPEQALRAATGPRRVIDRVLAAAREGTTPSRAAAGQT